MRRKPFSHVQLSVMGRLLCSLLMSLAVTDGAVPYPSCTCQHHSQPLENHQLEQCIDSQSYRPITYCLHNHAMYIQGPGCQKCFPVVPPTASNSPPPEDPNPGRYPDTMTLPSCPCSFIYPSGVDATPMLQPRTGVCLPNEWKNLLDRNNNANK